MKILILTGIFPPDIGGPATYVARLAFELQKRNHQIKVITYSDKVDLTEKDQYKFEIIRILRNNILPLRYGLFFWHTLLNCFKSDVVYAQCLVSSGLPAWLAVKLSGKRFVLKITGDYAWEQARQRWNNEDSIEDFQQRKYNWQTELIRKVEKTTARKANKIIVPSLYLKEIVSQWGIDQDKIWIIYNAVEALPGPDISQKQAQDIINVRGNILLSVGRLVPWKGFDLLIDIMPKLLNKNPDFKLIIIGSGPQKNNLVFKIKNLGLEKSAFLIDSVDQKKLSLYFKAANVFILNSSYEGLPHIILEVMQMQLPVITTNIGGNPEVVKNNENGLLIEPNNKEQLLEAILRLQQSQALKQQLVRNASQSLKKFDFKQMINQTLEVLKT